MALHSSDVNAGDDILATHNNNLIDDIQDHTHDGTDTAKVDFTANPETRYYGIYPPDFVCEPYNNCFLDDNGTHLRTISDTDPLTGYASVHLPHGATITSFKVYWYRDDAAATGAAYFNRCSISGITGVANAEAHSNATTGYHSVEDTTITFPIVDSQLYKYYILSTLDPNNSHDDVRFVGAVITYTIVEPLP